MKRRVLVFLFSLFFILLSFILVKMVRAAVVPCGSIPSQPNVPCTFCKPNPDFTCVVDYGLETCTDNGYFPDLDFCSNFSGGACQQGFTKGNCVEAETCKNNGEDCTGVGQGTCCDGLECKDDGSGNYSCQVPSSCIPFDSECPGPQGTEGGCCPGLECNVKAIGNPTLYCVDKPAPVGYRCDMAIFQCMQCLAGDTNPDCNPPQYSDPDVCLNACTHGNLKKYRCDTDRGCIEDQNGQYPSWGACNDVCNRSLPDIFCDPSNPSKPTNENTGLLFTAIGCIPIGDPNQLVAFILRWAFGIGGGISFLLIIYAGFMIMTSSGNPERLKAGQELLTSAIMGLLLLIFSVFILRIIGVNILKIPGL